MPRARLLVQSDRDVQWRQAGREQVPEGRATGADEEEQRAGEEGAGKDQGRLGRDRCQFVEYVHVSEENGAVAALGEDWGGRGDEEGWDVGCTMELHGEGHSGWSLGATAGS